MNFIVGQLYELALKLVLDYHGAGRGSDARETT